MTPHLNKAQKICASEFLILSALKFPSCGIVGFINMDSFILTEGRTRNFKALPKENYPIVLDHCYIFTKKMLNIELKMMLTVLIEFTYFKNLSAL